MQRAKSPLLAIGGAYPLSGRSADDPLLRLARRLRQDRRGDRVMKATLIVIENNTDHARAKTLVAKLMVSRDRKDAARLAAQARLMEAYEQSRWPRRLPRTADILTYLMEQHGLTR